MIMSIDYQTETMTDDLSRLNGEFSMKDSESEIYDDEVDHIPLKERLRLKYEHDVIERETKRLKRSPAPIDSAIKTEEAQCSSQDTLLDQSDASLAGVEKDGRSSQEQICAFADSAPQTNGAVVPKEVVLALPAACFAGEKQTPRVRKRNAAVVPKVATKVGSNMVIRCSENTSTYQDEDLPQNCNVRETQANTSTCFNQIIRPKAKEGTHDMVNLDVGVHTIKEHPTFSTPTIKVKVEHSDNDLMSQGCHGAIVKPIKVKTEIHDELETDELDHIPLKERQRMLLSRQSMGIVSQLNSPGSLEGAYLEPSTSYVGDIYQQIAGKVEEESRPADEKQLARNESLSIPETNASECLRTSIFDPPTSGAAPSGTIPESSIKDSNVEDKISSESGISCGIQENEQLSHISSTELNSPAEQEVLPACPQNMVGSAMPAFLVKVKDETLENGLEGSCRNEPSISSYENMLAVKREMGVSSEYFEDELDHMLLSERLKLLTSGKVSNLDCLGSLNWLQEAVPPHLKCKPAVSKNAKPAVSENANPAVINRPRKRKKTATDSVETALEEDAPGLLQVLVDKGVLVDEIKLYGGMESEEALDSSFEESSFEDLETVISKLFAERASLFKFAPLQCRKGSKSSTYCLACLISLIEQSRYLQFRKWPVEWGWCRDLQSFIFVFQRHNRIVLERPEYGYATYFFELVDSLPIDWQIKRLVTAMKLTSCSRSTIIENRSLLVGEDLTEGEARVLEEYGWIPNSGIGSMLNYCDRVVHDRKNEKDGSEWRSKIGNLLLTGLNGGTIVLNNLPKKLMGYEGSSSSQIKLEL